jgi:hypothetical protein
LFSIQIWGKNEGVKMGGLGNLDKEKCEKCEGFIS